MSHSLDFIEAIVAEWVGKRPVLRSVVSFKIEQLFGSSGYTITLFTLVDGTLYRVAVSIDRFVLSNQTSGRLEEYIGYSLRQAAMSLIFDAALPAPSDAPELALEKLDKMSKQLSSPDMRLDADLVRKMRALEAWRKP